MSLTARNMAAPRRPYALLAALIAAGLGLAGCTVGTAGAPQASADPNVFYARLAQADLTGVYNPAGFASDEVQTGLAQICGNRKITRYSEAPAGGDMVAFSGHCWGGTDILSGEVTFTRFGSSLRIEVPGYLDRDRLRESRRWSIRL